MELFLSNNQIERLVELLEKNLDDRNDSDLLTYLKYKMIRTPKAEFDSYEDLDDIPF